MLLIDVDADLHAVLNLTEKREDVDLPPRVIEAALDRLSKSRVRDPDMRVVVADDKRSSETTLSRLARSAEDRVRQSVVTNPHTPIGVLEQLARDLAPSVRAMVAGNPLSPAIVLAALSTMRIRSSELRRPGILIFHEASLKPCLSMLRSACEAPL